MKEQRLPPYTHIPGITPHPVSSPAGHMYRSNPVAVVDHATKTLAAPQSFIALIESFEFQWGMTLFQEGYYWESHEVWESLWNWLHRSGQLADLIKGLIKVAAAGVKLREWNSSGFCRHMLRASELFESLAAVDWLSDAKLASHWTRQLASWSRGMIEAPPQFPKDRTGRPIPLFHCPLY